MNMPYAICHNWKNNIFEIKNEHVRNCIKIKLNQTQAMTTRNRVTKRQETRQAISVHSNLCELLNVSHTWVTWEGPLQLDGVVGQVGQSLLKGQGHAEGVRLTNGHPLLQVTGQAGVVSRQGHIASLCHIADGVRPRHGALVVAGGVVGGARREGEWPLLGRVVEDGHGALFVETGGGRRGTCKHIRCMVLTSTSDVWSWQAHQVYGHDKHIRCTVLTSTSGVRSWQAHQVYCHDKHIRCTVMTSTSGVLSWQAHQVYDHGKHIRCTVMTSTSGVRSWQAHQVYGHDKHIKCTIMASTSGVPSWQAHQVYHHDKHI